MKLSAITDTESDELELEALLSIQENADCGHTCEGCAWERNRIKELTERLSSAAPSRSKTAEAVVSSRNTGTG